MSTPPPSPDASAAPALRRALRVEQARRQGLEQEHGRLRDALARQNARLGGLEAEDQALRERGRELAEQVTAVLAQVQALAGEVAARREENARRRAERGEEPQGAAARRPPNWAKAKVPKPAAKRRRKKRATEHTRGRRRLPGATVTQVVEHAPDACPFRRDPRRGGRVVDDLLGARTGRVFVSDCYAAYDHCPERHQRRWAHLWRDVDDLQSRHPGDAALAAWVERRRGIRDAATGPRPGAEEGENKAARRARAARARRFERQVRACCPESLPPERPEAGLAARLRRYLDDPFTFVRDPAVPPTDNLAERRRRPLVIGRKISGGTRSKEGSDDRMALTSVLQTAPLRGDDPYQTCSAFLSAPAPPAII